VASDRFRDGTAVDLTAVDPRGRRPAGWLVDLRYLAADGTVVAAEVSERVADPALPLWFAEVAHATSDIPAASIHAFTGGALPPGSFVTPREVAARGLRMADRIGEIRWWTRSGLLDVLAVQPAGHGHGVGRALGHLAETLAVFRGWARLTVGTDSREDDVGLDGAPQDWRPLLRPAG
jgi:GNAT superfamily N-acetyltransferase